MNQVQFEQSWGQLQGYLQKQWGEFTDEDLLQIDGNQERFNGANHKRYGKLEAEVTKWADRWYAKWIGWYEGYVEAKPRA